MLALPLYKETPRSPVETCGKQEHDAGCRRCSLHTSVRNVCMSPDGTPGEGPTLLVVGLAPGAHEDQVGRVMVGSSGQYLRATLSKYWTGPIVYTNALSCYNGDTPVTEKMITACRPYVSSTIAEAQPDRILSLGADAATSLTGRSVPVGSVQGGYQILHKGNLVNKDTPIYFLPHPASIRGNHLRRRDFEEQLVWALRRFKPVGPPLKGRAYIVRSVEDAEEVERLILEESDLANLSIDIETFGVPYDDMEIISCALAITGSDHSWVWPDKACQDKAIRAPLVRLIENPDIRKVLQNGKSDATGLIYCWNARIKNFAADTRIMRRLHTADAMAKLSVLSELVGVGGYKQAFEPILDAAVAQLKKETKYIRQTKLLLDRDAARLERAAKRIAGGEDPKRYAYGLVPEDKLSIYNALDAVVTMRVGERTEQDLDSVIVPHAGRKLRPLRDVWTQVSGPANMALIEMENWGVPVSRRGLEDLSAHLSRKLVDLSKEFEVYKINPDSPEQIGQLLFRKLKLPILETTPKGAPSTDASVLERLKGRHPIIDTILEYRGYQKMLGTYVDGMMQHIRPDGRIHPTIMADGTRTGRVSVREPNMNNWPSTDDGGTEAIMLRDCVSASPGNVLIEIDQCFVAGTMIDTPYGPRAIEQMGAGSEVRSYNFETKKVVFNRVNQKLRIGVRPVYQIEIGERGRKSKYVTCTAEHKWFVINSKNEPVATCTVDLRRGDFLLPVKTSKKIFVRSIQYAGEKEVWSIGVLPYKNYALEAGVFVKNSQVELRVAAALSGDDVMRGIYQIPDADFHLETAKRLGSILFKMDPSTITKNTMDPKDKWNIRRASKTTNFATLYGGGASSVASSLGCSVEDAKKIVGGIQGVFPQFYKWAARMVDIVRKEGYIWTSWKGQPWRRRALFDVGNPKRGDEREDALRIRAEHGCTNSPIQSKASEFQLASLLPVVKWLMSANIPAKLMLTIYDSLVFECREDYVDKVVGFVAPLMTSWPNDGVPLEVDVKIGRTWGQMRKWKSGK